MHPNVGCRWRPSPLRSAAIAVVREVVGFLSRRHSAVDERLVEVHLTEKGRELHPQTGCLTDALLRHSGFEVPQMIELNRCVQALRQGMRGAAGAGIQEVDDRAEA